MRRVINHLVALISAVAAVAALVPLLASEAVRTWAKGHSSWVYAGLVSAALAAFFAVDCAITLNRKCCSLEASIKPVSDHDKRFLHQILQQLPLNGEVITWLKHDFFVKRIPIARMDALVQAYEQLILYPVGFDNPEVQEEYQVLISWIESFISTVTQWARFDSDRRDALAVPLAMQESEQGEQGYYAALKDIGETVLALVAAYDSFISTCQRNGMDIYAPASA